MHYHHSGLLNRPEPSRLITLPIPYHTPMTQKLYGLLIFLSLISQAFAQTPPPPTPNLQKFIDDRLAAGESRIVIPPEDTTQSHKKMSTSDSKT
ncbi:hypothetical protein [Rubritalea tangerina]|uniref:hypothetical protein n=1 Tax=Rubritalea tangerina TaxID=430798 RepID=UPI00360929AC